jgi:predicted DNA-binding transcriptional regulator AlpA
MSDTMPQTFDDLVKFCLGLQERCQRLQELVLNTPRLHRKDICRRYGWSDSTFFRKQRVGKIPPPVELGHIWRLEDIEAAEKAGQLPCPVSG